MQTDYRTQLFSTYSSTHVAHIDSDSAPKARWFVDYAERNYFPHLSQFDKNSARVLEIACNRGYLLKTFCDKGFRKLHGIDMSPDDVEVAKTLVPSAMITTGDALSLLKAHPAGFDVILMKAMLEHVSKSEVLNFLYQIKDALSENGVLIIDVPNMDWLFASHERYMDFTHEVGFTRESLAQVMRNVFETVEIRQALFVPGTTTKSKLAGVLRPFIIDAANAIFRIIGEGASDVWWDSRAIIGIGRKLSQE